MYCRKLQLKKLVKTKNFYLGLKIKKFFGAKREQASKKFSVLNQTYFGLLKVLSDEAGQSFNTTTAVENLFLVCT